jgi:hypothetical protein
MASTASTASVTLRTWSTRSPTISTRWPAAWVAMGAVRSRATASSTRGGSVDYEPFDGGVRGRGEIFSGDLGMDVDSLEFEVACR